MSAPALNEGVESAPGSPSPSNEENAIVEGKRDMLSCLKPEQRNRIQSTTEDLEQRLATQAVNDPLAAMPADNFTVETVVKQPRCAQPSVTPEIKKITAGTQAEPHVSIYDRDYELIKKNYSRMELPVEREEYLPIPDTEWPDNSLNDPEKENKLFLNVNILRSYKAEDASRDRALRENAARQPLFSVFPVHRLESEKVLDSRVPVEPYRDRRSVTRLFVECDKLSFSLGDIEPFFCYGALYDIGKKVKISENWSFDCNSSGMNAKLGSRVVKQCETSSRKAIFNVDTASSDVYFLVRVEKILRGVELDASVEPYAKGQLKPKDLQKLEKEMDINITRLGDFLQPFAWGAIQVFNEGGQLQVGDLTQLKLIRSKLDDTETSILELLRKRQGKDKRISALPCDFVFNFRILSEEQRSQVKDLVDPSYLPVNEDMVSTPATRDIQDFHEFDSVSAPNLEYVNTLYVYPESVNFTKHKDSASRNITVKVQMLENDSDPNGTGMNVIYGRSSGTSHRTFARTPVFYHKKTPTWTEETKIRLPAALTPQHHILFTFTHVVCQAKGKSTEVENLLGYAAIPYFTDNKILEDSTYTVPVAASIIPGYLSPDAEASIKWVDSKKPIFTFRTKLCSTIFSQDGNLNEFFKQYELDSNSKQLVMALRKLNIVESNSLAQFYPVILNMILGVLCRHTDSTGSEAFESLLVILKKVCTLPAQEDTDSFLQFYIRFIFNNPDGSVEQLPYLALLGRLSDAIESPDSALVDRALEQAPYIFDMSIKSMTLDLYKRGILNGKREDAFSSKFYGTLRTLVRGVTSQIIKGCDDKLSYYLALFLKDLLALADRGVVFQLINGFISRLDPRNTRAPLVKQKFRALQVLGCYEHFVPINNPVIHEFSSVTAIFEENWVQHYLVGLLLDEVTGAMDSPSESIRLTALHCLRDVIWCIHQSPYFVSSKNQERVATMFFPFLLSALERVETWKGVAEGERLELSACVLFVLRYCNKPLVLHKWWKEDTQKSHIAFLNLLSVCVSPSKDDHFIRESNFVILDTLEDYMSIMGSELGADDGPLMQSFFQVFMEFLLARETVSFLSCLSLSLRRFIHQFAEQIFSWENTSYCENLCYRIMRLTDSENVITRSEAGSLIYMIIKTNYGIRNNFSRTKLQATIAISRMCGESKGHEFLHLQRTLNYVSKLAKKEFQNSPLGVEVEQLIARLFAVIKDSMNIAKYEYDPQMISQLTYKVSLGYRESPDLRLTWLKNLAAFHKSAKNYEELAQVKFVIAALILESLRIKAAAAGQSKVHTGLPLTKEGLTFICPNIPYEPDHPTATNKDESLFNSTLFSENGLVETLSSAVGVLKMCQRFETCIDMYNILLEYYQTRKDYGNLSSAFDKLGGICELLVTTDKNEGRLFNNYYRVLFLGESFGEINGKEVVYKEDAMVRVAEFTDRLKNQFSKIGTLNVLPNGEVNPAKLDKSAIYVQIIAVQPYFVGETVERKSDWDRNFNIHRFIYETPFTTTGKAQGDLSVQCKKKTIITTQFAFPYVRKRIEVIDRDEIILQPLQNAIEIIQSREKALRQELQLSPPNPKTLQIQLQGAVLAQVNAGPIEIAKTFLGDNSVKYLPDADPSGAQNDLETLCASLKEFMVVCKFALKLNNTLIQSDQIPFQQECESNYTKLNAEVEKIIQSTYGTSYYSPSQ